MVLAACSTLKTSGHASAVSDACARLRLGVLLMTRQWLLGVGAFSRCCFCGVLGHLVWGEGMYALHMRKLGVTQISFKYLKCH